MNGKAMVNRRFTVSKAGRPVIWLLIANTVSQIGNSFSMLAIPWFVLETTGSASRTGITVAVGVAPMIIAGLFGGAIVDRLGYRQSSVVSDVLSGISVLLIPLLHQTVGLGYGQLLALVILGAVLDAPGRSARTALFPEIVQLTSMPLERANALYQVTGRIANLLAPPMAGVLIAVMGPANLLWLDAATFAVSAAIVAMCVPPPPVQAALGAIGGVRGYLRDIADGFRFLHGSTFLFWMLVAFSVGSLVAEPLYSVILPVYANEVLDSPVALGFIFSALGIGSLVGNLLYVTIGMRLSRSTILLGGFAVRGLAFAVMLTMPPWWVIAAAIFIGAVALEPINPMTMTVFQEQVPTGMRGRVLGVQGAIASATLPVGIIIYGFLMSAIGMQATLVLFVAVNCAFPIWMATVPHLRGIARPSPATALDETPAS
jgi:MFS family permease